MTTPISNSDIAGNIDFVHTRGNTFIRVLEIKDNQTPRQPINLVGYTFVLKIKKLIKSAEPDVLISSSDYITTSGDDNNLININAPKELFLFDSGKYFHEIVATSSGNITQTWLRGSFILKDI